MGAANNIEDRNYLRDSSTKTEIITVFDPFLQGVGAAQWARIGFRLGGLATLRDLFIVCANSAPVPCIFELQSSYMAEFDKVHQRNFEKFQRFSRY